LNSPLPQDLIPILTKDESKRQELAAKSAAAKSAAAKSAVALNERGKEKDSEKQKDKEKEKEKPQDKEKEKEKQQEKKEKDKLKDKDNKSKEKAILTQNLEPKSEFRKPEIRIEEDKSQKTNGDSTESKSTNDKVSDKPISAADKAPLQFPPGRTTATTPTNSQFKLNAKASEWKPNPNAASFTPVRLYVSSLFSLIVDYFG